MHIFRVTLFLLALALLNACNDDKPVVRNTEAKATVPTPKVETAVEPNTPVERKAPELPDGADTLAISSSSDNLQTISSSSGKDVVLSSSSTGKDVVQFSSSAGKGVSSSSSSVQVEKAEPAAISSSSEALPESSSAVIDSSICGDIPKGHFCDLRDGHVYKVVHIGAQTWMAENLNFASEGSWCYNDDEKNCDKYGRLYNWTTAMGIEVLYQTQMAKKILKWKMQGVCPEGWHVPSMNEMNVLNSFVQEKNSMDVSVHEDVGTSLKSKVGWEEDDEVPPGSNRYGFSAKPAGFRSASATYTNLLEDANFWVADEVGEDPTHAHYWNLYYANEKFWGSSNNFKTFAFSVRCLKN